MLIILLIALAATLVLIAVLYRDYAEACDLLKRLEAEHQRMSWKLTKLTGDDKPWRAEK